MLPPKTLSELLDDARSGLKRLSPLELSQRADAIVLDTRTPTDRALYGCIPGALHVPRTVLEWRVAQDAPLRLGQITSTEQTLVVMCNEGFSSSLAAATLQSLGYENATDLVGGFLAWRDAGLPIERGTNDEIGIRPDPSGPQ